MILHRRRLWRAVLVMALGLVIAGCDLLTGASPDTSPAASVAPAEATRRPRRTPTPAASRDPGLPAQATPRRTRRPRSTPSPAAPSVAPQPTPKPTRMPPIDGFAELAGSDGRLTLLLLGSDARAGVVGERTDAIMVATSDPGTGRVAMASLPRDTVNVPIVGGVYGPRITGLLQQFQLDGATRREALRRVVRSMEIAFDTQIDGYVLIGFGGVRRLIDHIGGVDVFLDRALWDSTMHVGRKGLKLKAGWNHLDGNRALAFARTRHTDSDYQRAARQQQLVMAVMAKVLDNGPTALPELAARAVALVETDLTLDSLAVLLELASRARLRNYKSVVLAPGTYAEAGPEQYTIQMRLDAVRGVFDRLFGPVDG